MGQLVATAWWSLRPLSCTGFGPVEELRQSCGVAYVCNSSRIFRMEDLRLVSELAPGTNQFFEWNMSPNGSVHSVWASAEGFFFCNAEKLG